VRVLGTVGHAAIATHFQLAHGRRADFVPPHLLSVEAACQATAENTFHAFSAIECHWPPADSSNRSVLILSAAVPDIRRPNASSANITLPALPATTLLDWVRAATPHPPTGLAGPGILAGTLAWRPAAAPPDPVWFGELEFSGESLQSPALGPDPIPLGDILLRPTPVLTANQSGGRHAGRPAPQPASGFDLLPISLPLGGKQPATLEGHFDATGYTLHLTGTAIPARLLALADAIPQFGDGLRKLLDPTAAILSEARGAQPDDPEAVHAATSVRPSQPQESTAAASTTPDQPATPTHFDLTATRTWGSPQIWRETQTAPTPHHHK
jgi:hypothetical protein